MQGSHVGARMRRAVLGSAALAALVFFAIAGTAFAHPKGPAPVEIVSQSAPPAEIPAGTTYFSTIQAAVNASTPGTFILVEPGIYKEEVKIVEPHNNIYIRGMNRNTTILDGQGLNPAGGSNGIERHVDVLGEGLGPGGKRQTEAELWAWREPLGVGDGEPGLA